MALAKGVCLGLQGLVLLAPAVDITRHWLGRLSESERRHAESTGSLLMKSEYDPIRFAAATWLPDMAPLQAHLAVSAPPRADPFSTHLQGQVSAGQTTVWDINVLLT